MKKNRTALSLFPFIFLLQNYSMSINRKGLGKAMAVQISKSGGIYIEISGDVTKLGESLAEADRLAKKSGNSISESLSGALAPKDAARHIGNLGKYFHQAAASAKAASADLSQYQGLFQKIGKKIGVAEKDLQKFAAANAKALQTQTQKSFLDNLKGIQRLTGSTNAEMNKLAKSLGGVGNEFSKASSGIKAFGINFGSMAKIAVGAFGLSKLSEIGKESFDLAARYETLGVVVQQVGKTAGYSAVEIDKQVSAIRRMGIAGIEARKTLTQLIQAQVDISKTPALARIAQDAAVIGGTNSSEAFERLVHGIQGANTQVLRGIGINVNFEKAYASMAAKIGKTTSELTEQEKTQARLNAVIEEGRGIVGSYEAALGTMGKQISSLSRLHQDFGTDFGKLLLEVAKASEGIKDYARSLSGLNMGILLLRGSISGVSVDDLYRTIQEGSLQLGRDIVEAAEAAQDGIEILQAQMRAASAQGIDTAPIERQLGIIKERFKNGALSANIYRLAIIELGAIMRAQLTQVAENAPGADILDIAGQAAKLREQYQQTTEAKRQAAIAEIKERQRMMKVLRGQFTSEEYSSMTAAFEKELDKLTKSSRAAGVAIERTAHQSAQAYKEAVDGLAALTMRSAELRAGLQGETLEASFEKINRQIETQLAKIISQQAKLEADARMWTKGGKMDAEALTNVSLAQAQLELQKKELEIQRALEKEQAKRNALARDYRASMDYATLIGDARGYYAEEMKLLELQMLSASAAEKRTLAERQRIAAARRDLDIPGLIQTGLQTESLKVYQDYIKFLEDIPSAAGSAADAIGTFAADVGTSAKNIDNAWSDLGNSLASTVRKMIADLTSLCLRMALVGNLGQSGGKLGGLFGAIASLFSGPGINSAGTSWSTGAGDISIPDLDLASLFHTGGVVGQIAPSRIVAASVFAEAPRYHNGGIAGLRPDERAAILRVGEEVITDIDPRHRNNLHTSSGVQSPQTNIQIVDQRGANAPEVEMQQAPNAQGGIDVKLIIKSEQQRNFASGSMDGIMRNRYGIRPQVVGR